jgi:hypothetical protein
MIVIISGIRRCGKSVLLQQIRKKQREQDYYLNFDDERLINFSVDHFQLLYEVFVELFGVQNTLYFDEIQNVLGWERFVRRLHDSGAKVFITGSNASLLSRELGTHLTGRYLQYELFPFSFAEYLQQRKIYPERLDGLTTIEKGNMLSAFNEYLKIGGFPGYYRNKMNDYLKYLYESVLYRDVMVRNNITNEKELLKLVNFLSGNIAKIHSTTSLAKVIGVKNVTTVKNYISYMEDAYLLFQVVKYDHSLKAQYINPKKVYFIDTALSRILGFRTSEDYGRILENLVFLELKRRKHEIFYHSSKSECDFLIKEGNKISTAIQVSGYIADQQTRDREIKGLMEAMKTQNLDIGYLLTADTNEVILVDKKTIHIIPVWKWLLSKQNA